MVGTPEYGTTMSTWPSLPNPGSILPVLAFSAINLRPEVNRMRGGFCLSPGQYATPRCDATPAANSYLQISEPVTGLSASTRLPAGRYITPLTTIGVAADVVTRAPGSAKGSSG